MHHKRGANTKIDDLIGETRIVIVNTAAFQDLEQWRYASLRGSVISSQARNICVAGPLTSLPASSSTLRTVRRFRGFLAYFVFCSISALRITSTFFKPSRTDKIRSSRFGQPLSLKLPFFDDQYSFRISCNKTGIHKQHVYDFYMLPMRINHAAFRFMLDDG